MADEAGTVMAAANASNAAERAKSRYGSFVIVADPIHGILAPSWQLKESLEEAGHAVFWFAPDRWSGLFQGKTVDLSRLSALVRRWDVASVVLADGLCPLDGEENGDSATSTHCLVTALVCSEAELESVSSWLVPGSICLALGQRLAGLAESRNYRAFSLAPTCSDILVRSQLVNTIALRPGVVCMQGATPERIAAIESLIAGEGIRGLPVRCFGEGWPDEWRADDYAGPAYAMGSSECLVVFENSSEDGSSSLTEFYVSCYAAMGGGDLLYVGGEGKVRAHGHVRQSVAGSSAFDSDACASAAAMLGACACEGALGFNRPARLATVLGYVGRGNFGDEYILSTIADRLERRCPGTVTVAVGEDPWHTLVNRGIYSITLRDKQALGEMLSRSVVALVMAGLLFDQGIRWTMGKSELVSSVLHTDIPGIAAFTELAALNTTPTVLYGIGAGPLEAADSKRLVGLMGFFGARFACRDEETQRLVAACDVPESQVLRRADVAFTGSSPRTAAVDSWLSAHGANELGVRLLVVSLREYENVPNGFEERVASALDAALSTHGDVRVVFALLDRADRAISERVRSGMKCAGRTLIFDSGDDVDAVGDLLERAATGLSMRYHCSLLLFRKGAPCVGLGYLPKVSALYEEVGVAGKLLLPMDASTNKMVQSLKYALDSAEEASACVRGGVETLMRLAQTSEDELVGVVEAGDPVCERLPSERDIYLFNKPAIDRELEAARSGLGVAERDLESSRDEVARLKAELAETKDRVRELEESNSFKIGSALMYVPGKVKRILKKAD